MLGVDPKHVSASMRPGVDRARRAEERDEPVHCRYADVDAIGEPFPGVFAGLPGVDDASSKLFRWRCGYSRIGGGAILERKPVRATRALPAVRERRARSVRRRRVGPR
jgi:hypothetical protein